MLKRYGSRGNHDDIYKELEKNILNLWSGSAENVYLKESYTLKNFLSTLKDILDTRSVNIEQWKYITRKGNLTNCVVALHIERTIKQAGDIKRAISEIESNYPRNLRIYLGDRNYKVEVFIQHLDNLVNRNEVEKLPEMFNLKQTVMNNMGQARNDENRGISDSV